MVEYITNFVGNICEMMTIIYFYSGRFEKKVSEKVFVPICLILLVYQFSVTNLFLKKSVLIVFATFIYTF